MQKSQICVIQVEIKYPKMFDKIGSEMSPNQSKRFSLKRFRAFSLLS